MSFINKVWMPWHPCWRGPCLTIDLRIKNENCRVSCRFAAIKGHKFHHHIASEFVVDAACAPNFRTPTHYVHSRFSQFPSLKKLLQQQIGYFLIPNDKKNSWGKFEVMFPGLFLRYWPKSEKYGPKQPNLSLLP